MVVVVVVVVVGVFEGVFVVVNVDGVVVIFGPHPTTSSQFEGVNRSLSNALFAALIIGYRPSPHTPSKSSKSKAQNIIPPKLFGFTMFWTLNATLS